MGPRSMVGSTLRTPGMAVGVTEGIGELVGPAAAGLAGLAHELRAGRMNVVGQRVVAVCTGHGMKDPDIIAHSMAKPQVLPAELRELEKVLVP